MERKIIFDLVNSSMLIGCECVTIRIASNHLGLLIDYQNQLVDGWSMLAVSKNYDLDEPLKTKDIFF